MNEDTNDFVEEGGMTHIKDSELQAKVNQFIDDIAVLRPYTRVTKEAKRRLIALIKSDREIRDNHVRLDEQKAVTEWLTDAEHVGTIRNFNQLRRMKLEAQLSKGEKQ